MISNERHASNTLIGIAELSRLLQAAGLKNPCWAAHKVLRIELGHVRPFAATTAAELRRWANETELPKAVRVLAALPDMESAP